MTDKGTGKLKLQRGINLTPCEREQAFLRKVVSQNILVTQGFLWKTRAFYHLPIKKTKKAFLCTELVKISFTNCNKK